MPLAALVLGVSLFAAAASGAPATGSAPAGEPVLRVGSKRFTESYILAEIATHAVQQAGGKAEHVQGLGGTALVFRALEEGSIDVYPEYTGTIAEAILHRRAGEGADLEALRRALAPEGIGVGDPVGFENTYALAVAVALRGRVSKISDLAAESDLRFGLSPEFLGRSDGFPALAARYGLPQRHVEALEHGLAYGALSRGAVDVIDVYSTDAAIERYGLAVLADDRHFFHPYEAVFLYREEARERAPSALRAIASLSGTIDAGTMVRLNALADVHGWTFAAVGAEFLRSRQPPGASPDAADPSRTRPSLLPGIVSVVRTEGPRHVGLVALSLLVAIAVGVPTGILASRNRAAGRIIVGATSVAQTIPALALLCFFVPLLGTGPLPALASLFLYALLPIVRNTIAGLDGIAPGLRESAAALGLSHAARLLRVDLPLASRTILAGIRTSAVIAVGGATLAAFVGAGGFGAPISTGLNLDDTTLILEGAIPAALLALGVEGAFALLEHLMIPRGLRKSREDEHGPNHRS